MARRRSAQAEGVPNLARPLRFAPIQILLGLALFALRLPAQGIGGGAFHSEPRGFEFPPGSVWQSRAALVRAQRTQLMSQGALASLNSPSAPAVHGHLRVAVIPVLFQGTTAPYPALQYQDLLFGPASPLRATATSYYLEQSRGALILEGKVFDWVPLPNPESYYTDGCNGIGVKTACPVRARSRMLDFLEDALGGVSNGADGSSAWLGFDNDGADGVTDSGDDDGVVDLVIVLHPSVDGACGGNGLWSHRYGLASWGSGNGNGYVTQTPRRNIHGQPIPGAFLTVNAYTLQSALGGNDACTATAIMPIGTVAHETGHAFGLPDLYDTDVTSATSGIGEWGLMGAGNYARPYSPASFDAWSLAQLGWVTIDTLRNGVTRTIGPVQRSDTVYLGRTADAGFNFLLENRQAVGTDSAMMNPTFVRAKSPGLLIWLLDEARILSAWASNRINTGTRQGIALIQADGFNQLRSSGPNKNRGDTGDSWPGARNNSDLGLATIPAAVNWAEQPLDTRFDQITALPDGVIRFRYTQRAPTVVASESPGVRIRFGQHLGSQVREVLLAGESFVVGADSMQIAFDGRSAAQFQQWSDGGARTHAVTARAGAPDTLTATFNLLHRLRVTVAGPGSVTSSESGVSGAGVFLAAGTSATVTAVPSSGAEFLGWRGDTTSFATTLPVAVTRAVDLIAVFATKVTLDPKAVLRAVLGGPPLDAASVQYLDAVGNQNGILDVGDYLAWLRRTGNGLPSSKVGGTP